MQLPHDRLPVPRLLGLAHFTATALRRYVAVMTPPAALATELEELADGVDAVRQSLSATAASLDAADSEQLGPRFEVRLIDHRADKLVRSLFRAAEEANVKRDLFPKGLKAVTRFFGQSQIDALDALTPRVATCSAWAERAGWATRLHAMSSLYAEALTARTAATKKVAAARAVRDDARRSLVSVMRATGGAVRALFPMEPEVQDLFFDDFRATESDEDDTEADAGVA